MLRTLFWNGNETSDYVDDVDKSDSSLKQGIEKIANEGKTN
jgi:hypothetical protein